MFSGLWLWPGRQETDKEPGAGGGMFAVSLVVAMEGVVATAGSEVLRVGEDDVTDTLALAAATGLPFCLTWKLSLFSAVTVSLSLSMSGTEQSLETQL